MFIPCHPGRTLIREATAMIETFRIAEVIAVGEDFSTTLVFQNQRQRRITVKSSKRADEGGGHENRVNGTITTTDEEETGQTLTVDLKVEMWQRNGVMHVRPAV
jgi:hypothetical protein